MQWAAAWATTGTAIAVVTAQLKAIFAARLRQVLGMI
jgi:hypothetical protein